MSAPNPDCKTCWGTGLVPDEQKPPHPPVHRRCECVLYKDILENVERALAGLSAAPVIKSSPLLGKEEKNVRITAGGKFQAHLRHVAIRKPVSWNLRVVSDAELVTAWLASIALKGEDIIDADAHLISTKFLTIPDLVVPPDLVVIRMGIKVARNVAASEVLAEAIQTRFHEGKPTWLWEEPHSPLNSGHMFWSDVVGRILRSWEHIPNLDSPIRPSPTAAPVEKKQVRKTLRGSS